MDEGRDFWCARKGAYISMRRVVDVGSRCGRCERMDCSGISGVERTW